MKKEIKGRDLVNKKSNSVITPILRVAYKRKRRGDLKQSKLA